MSRKVSVITTQHTSCKHWQG